MNNNQPVLIYILICCETLRDFVFYFTDMTQRLLKNAEIAAFVAMDTIHLKLLVSVNILFTKLRNGVTIHRYTKTIKNREFLTEVEFVY